MSWELEATQVSSKTNDLLIDETYICATRIYCTFGNTHFTWEEAKKRAHREKKNTRQRTISNSVFFFLSIWTQPLAR